MTSNNSNDNKKSGNDVAKEVVRVPLSPMENLAMGSFSGALETSIQMPILTYKLCLQEGRPFPTTMKGWFRGVAVQAGTVAPITAIQFAVNGLLQSLVRGNDTQRKLNDMEVIGTAAGAGALSAVVYSPVDLTTIQQQKLAKNPVDTIRHLFKQYGVRGMTRGMMACSLRESVYTAGYLGLSPVITARLQQTPTFESSSPLVAKITGACLAGTAAAIVTHPVDTAKTVIQADIGRMEYPNARTAFGHLLKTEGVGSLYRGFIPRTVRICGAFFVCTTIQDKAIQIKSGMVSQGTW